MAVAVALDLEEFLLPDVGEVVRRPGVDGLFFCRSLGSFFPLLGYRNGGSRGFKGYPAGMEPVGHLPRDHPKPRSGRATGCTPRNNSTRL